MRFDETNVKSLFLKYESDANFRVQYGTVAPGQSPPPAYLLHGRNISKGRGALNLDLRSTPRWGSNSRPFVIIRGTGRLNITEISFHPIDRYDDVAGEKNSAFFWMPEEVRHTTINFLTPRFWNFERRIYWPDVLGKTMLAVAALAWLAHFFSRRVSLSVALPFLCLTCVGIYLIHFLITFVPLVHHQLFISDNEKIRQNYPVPEFGELAAKAREIIDSNSKVAIYGEQGDWFSPQALCFNLAPIPCVISDPTREQYSGISGIDQLRSSEIDTIVSYNSGQSLPDGFAKLFELNRNAFIARRK